MALPDPIPELRRQLVDDVLKFARPYGYCAAARLGIDSPRMADLFHGRVEAFGLHRLVRMLARVNRRVTLTVTVVPMPPERRFNTGVPRAPARRRRRLK